MSVNDELFDVLLRPTTERFYATAKSLEQLPVAEHTRTDRAWKLARLDALAEVGDLIAEAIRVPSPLWEDMRALAAGS